MVPKIQAETKQDSCCGETRQSSSKPSGQKLLQHETGVFVIEGLGSTTSQGVQQCFKCFQSFLEHDLYLFKR